MPESLGQQFERKMSQRIQGSNGLSEVARKVAEQMKLIAESNTSRGKTVKGGRYDRRYAKSTKRAKGKNDPVNLRDRHYSVEKMRATTTGTKAGVRGAKRLGDHDKGINYKNVGLRQRQMFPHTYNQVPESLENYMKRQIKKLLTGTNE